MAKIVVLGGSFGGLTAALEIKRLLGARADVTVVSNEDRFVFLPSLPWLIMGWRKPDDITLSVSEILRPKGIEFLHEAARLVDPENHLVETATRRVPYDYLVVSTDRTSPSTRFPVSSGQSYTDCTFTLDQAVRTAQTWKRILEKPGRWSSVPRRW